MNPNTSFRLWECSFLYHQIASLRLGKDIIEECTSLCGLIKIDACLSASMLPHFLGQGE